MQNLPCHLLREEVIYLLLYMPALSEWTFLLARKPSLCCFACCLVFLKTGKLYYNFMTDCVHTWNACLFLHAGEAENKAPFPPLWVCRYLIVTSFGPLPRSHPCGADWPRSKADVLLRAVVELYKYSVYSAGWTHTKQEGKQMGRNLIEAYTNFVWCGEFRTWGYLVRLNWKIQVGEIKALCTAHKRTVELTPTGHSDGHQIGWLWKKAAYASCTCVM